MVLYFRRPKSFCLCGKMVKYNRPMNFVEKLGASWWWMTQIFEEWCWQMTHDDGEFFNYLQSDYVKYEEDMYYMRKGES